MIRIRTLLLGLLLVATVRCADDESHVKTENCTRVTDAVGQTFTLCCRLTCHATWDGDDFRERCVEETTCTAATGVACPLSLAQAVGVPPCL